jgi:uncharacterized oxidoreductase
MGRAHEEIGMKLTGNTILITGGSAGIGLALARKFVELGNKVIVTGRSEDKLAAAKREVPELDTIQCDAADIDAIKGLAKTIGENHPDLNCLINNAGVMSHMNLTVPADDLAWLTHEVDINVSGLIRTVSALIDRLKQNKGTIINVSSGLAFVPLMSAPIYCATKAAVHSYTIAMRQQLQDSGVEVIELCPPAVHTALTADMPDDAGFKIMSTDELVAATIKGLRKGIEEICPGQAKQLRMMSRLAPGFIRGQLAKGSAAFVPKA